MDFLADLMETDVQTALERLGDLVVTDPDDATHVMTADEYLSGDVGGKLEHVRALLDAERGRAERQRPVRPGTNTLGSPSMPTACPSTSATRSRSCARRTYGRAA